MLNNLDQSLYTRFKREGYRIAKYKDSPVATIADLVRLGYLDVNRTIRGVTDEQSRSIKETVQAFVEGLLTRPPATIAEFDERHNQCCQDCVAHTAVGGARVHYGQSQKIVNMALKYLYNEYATYRGVSNQFGFPDMGVEHFFHLPIDNQVLDTLVGKCHFSKTTLLPWSQWPRTDYLQFQHQVRRRLNARYCPLELDYMIWNIKGPALDLAFMS